MRIEGQPIAAVDVPGASLLVLHHRPEMFRDVVTTRHPKLRIAECRSYGEAPGLLQRHAPEAVLSFKIPGDPDPFPAEALKACGSLRWIHVGAAGIDHLGHWEREKLEVTNSSGIHAETMAQYAASAMIAWTQHLHRYRRQQREKIWHRVDCVSLRGHTVVVVGFGKIGERIGATARFFGMKVIGIRANPLASEHADVVWPPSRLSEAAGLADFLILCLPLTPQTRGLVDRGVIDAIKPGAVLVNIARGGIVDEAALLDALNGGRLRGAQMDVFATEPLPSDSPFWEHEKVIVTPHSSSDYVGWERSVAELFCDNLDRLARSEPLVNLVDPMRGY